MKNFKKRDFVILILETVAAVSLIFLYKNVLTEKVNAWNETTDIRVSAEEKIKNDADVVSDGKAQDENGQQGKASPENERSEKLLLDKEQEKEEEHEEAQQEKKIAITFDDGPHPVYTEKLLDGLKERDVKATFFVLGEKAKAHPEIIERMEEEGHIIGNHTYTHIQLRSSNREQFRDELVLTNEVISEITEKEVQYVRPPYGTWDKKLEEELNMFPVLWNIDPNDWCTGNADKVTRRITDKAKENGIILLHDCYQSSVDAALASIDILMERGYRFVTVEEILFE